MEKMTVSEFQERIRSQHVTVLGLGISNRPVLDFLLSCGAVVEGRDKNDSAEMREFAAKLEKKGIATVLGDTYLDGIEADWIFKAPGIRRDLPELLQAEKNGCVLTSEMEVFFALCPCPIIAVTGSAGKTTTTTLTYLSLEEQARIDASDRRVFVGGNIGAPLLPQIAEIRPCDAVVVELSSFQLHAMNFSADRAAITNLSPNHLNWHTDMTEYVEAKKTVFRYQSQDGLLVLGADSEPTDAIRAEAPGHCTVFSVTKKPSFDHCDAVVYYENGCLYHETKDKKECMLRCGTVILPGRHNLANFAAVCALLHGIVSPEAIQHVADTFRGVRHRLELIREKDGVKYYNSSIDSSPDRTEAALSVFAKNVVLILGGSDKNIPFDPLAKPVCAHAKAVVLTGASAEKLRAALCGSEDFQKAGIPLYQEPTFDLAVRRAADCAKGGDVVLLSPACASFDAFRNFEHRGDTFRAIVESL